MKKLIPIIAGILFTSTTAYAQCGTNVTATTTDVTCNGGNNGSLDISVTGTAFQTSTRGLLLSEVHANPTGTDAAFEFVELIATKSIDFSVTPYTVFFSNNGTANANGWVAGGNLTYAFQISNGSVLAGDIIYVGGTSMLPITNQFRAINTAITGGDGGIGNANGSGSLGNGGSNADAVAVFDLPVSSITSSTVPIDAIFWGSGAGAAVVSGGTAGYELPVNDTYNGGKLQTTSYIGPDQTSVYFLKATGTYDIQTNSFTTPRVWTNSTTFSNLNSSVTLTGLFNFNWTPNNTTTEDLTGLTAGNYVVSVTDGNACTQSFTLAITEPAAVSGNTTVSPVSSCGATDGSVSVTASGGNGSYTYSWSPGGSTTATVNGLGAGTYICTVTDGNGCTGTANAIISSPGLNITESHTDILCNGDSSGTILLNVSGGSPSYNFTWSPAVSTGASASNLTAQTYTISVSDQGSCQGAVTVTLTEPTPIDIQFSSANISCYGVSDGTSNAIVTGGTAGYTYLWSPGNITTPAISGLSVGCYTVVVTDTNGCTAVATTCITQPAPVEAPILSGDTIICNPTILNACAVSGYNSYIWSNASTGLCVSIDTTVCLNILAFDSTGCGFTDTICVLDDICNNIASTTMPSFELYPNPACDYLQVNLPVGTSSAQIEIFNLQGALIHSQMINSSAQLDLKEISSGMYLVRINEQSQLLIIE